MAPKPRLLDECLRGAWDALNEHAPLRRCVLGITLLLTIVCISFSAFGVGSAAPSHGAYSPRLFAILFLPAELYLYDLFLGATVRTGAAMFLDMRLPLVLWAALRLALMGLGGMAAVILPGVFVLGMFKGAAGASVFIAIGLVAIIWITLMLRVFPQLSNVAVEYAWGGFVDITQNRAPDFGRLSRSIYYLQGFSGHGVNITGIAGKILAETIALENSRFDLFSKLHHRPFPGGALLRTPALVLGMSTSPMSVYSFACFFISVTSSFFHAGR